MIKSQKSLLSYHLKEPQEPRLDSLHLVLGEKKIRIEEILLDTGFNGDLAIPIDYAHLNNITEFIFNSVELANGSRKLMAITKGHVIISDLKLDVEILWLDETDEALLGSGFLAKFSNYLNINYKEDKIEIELK